MHHLHNGLLVGTRSLPIRMAARLEVFGRVDRYMLRYDVGQPWSTLRCCDQTLRSILLSLDPPI